MGWPALAAIGMNLVQGVIAADAAEDAEDAAYAASQQQRNDALLDRSINMELTRPAREGANAARDMMLNMVGLPGTSSGTGVMSAGGTANPIPGLNVPDPITFDDSKEAIDADMIAVYRAYLGRDPSQSELARLQGSGWTPRMLAQDASQSPEVRERLSGRTVDQPVGTSPGSTVSGKPASPIAPRTPEEIIKSDPGYNFRRQEGLDIREHSAAVRGGLLSGPGAERLERYGQDYASNEYQKLFGRLSTIAGYGQGATGQAGQGVMGTGTRIGAAMGDQGYNTATSYEQRGNIYGDTARNVYQGVMDWWGSRQPSGGPDPRNSDYVAARGRI